MVKVAVAPVRVARPPARDSAAFDTVTVVVVVLVCSTTRSPERVCPKTSRWMSVPATRRYAAPPGSTRATSASPTRIEVSTATPVLLARTSNVPVKDTPVTAMVTVPRTDTARPAAVTTSAPWTDPTCTGPRSMDPLAIPTANRVAPAVSTPLVIVRSAVIACPATVTVVPRACTRRNGADESTSTVTLVAKPRPATFEVMVAETDPRTPVAVTSKDPVIAVADSRTVLPLWIWKRPLSMAIVVVDTPATVTRCTVRASAAICWPAMVSEAFVAVSHTCWAALGSASVNRSRAKLPVRATPGRVAVRVPDSDPVTEVAETVRVPADPVFAKVSVEPTAKLRLLTVTVVVAAETAKETSAVNDWPSAAMVRPVPDNTSAAPASNTTSTWPLPSPRSMVSDTAAAKVLRRSRIRPEAVTPGTPVSATMPVASTAYSTAVPCAAMTRPTTPSLSETPTPEPPRKMDSPRTARRA